MKKKKNEGFVEPKAEDTFSPIVKENPIRNQYPVHHSIPCQVHPQPARLSEHMFIIDPAKQTPGYKPQCGPLNRRRHPDMYEAPESFYCYKTTGGMPLYFRLPEPPVIPRTKLQIVREYPVYLWLNTQTVLIGLLNAFGRTTKKVWTVIRHPLKTIKKK